MPSITRFCRLMRRYCDELSVGYDQSNRWDVRDGGETDCSALVIHCLREAGFDTGSASWTGDMADELCARGWHRVRPDGHPKKGDIILNEAHHVIACIDDDGTCAWASIDERGRASGGKAGDQTGRETRVGPYYVYSHGWDWYLRYGSGESEPIANGSGAVPQPDAPADAGSGDVRSVQMWLNATYSAGLAVDGIPGPETRKGLVKALQSELNSQFRRGLVVDGIWGEHTNAACVIVYPGARGNLTRVLQGGLMCRALSTGGLDGIYGRQTRQAVSTWQARAGIEADGIAGRDTFRTLLS